MQIHFDHQVEKFITSLEKPTIAKVLRTIDLLEHFGYQLGLPQSKKVKNNLFELRIHGQQPTRDACGGCRGRVECVVPRIRAADRKTAHAHRSGVAHVLAGKRRSCGTICQRVSGNTVISEGDRGASRAIVNLVNPRGTHRQGACGDGGCRCRRG